MNLEIKHLAPYVPYEPYARVIREDGEFDFIQLNAPQLNLFHHEYHYDFKPILRPFSDISNEIELPKDSPQIAIYGNKFIPLAELLKIKYPKWTKEKANSRYSEIHIENNRACFKYMATLEVKLMPQFSDFFLYNEYWIIEKLFEWHFDVFGLIEKKLALDYNTITIDFNKDY